MNCEHHRRDFARCPNCAAMAKAMGGQVLADWYRAANAARCDDQFPRRYVDARADHPQVIAWLKQWHTNPTSAPSLLLSGPTGVGKTHQAYGALRAAVTAPRHARWEAATFADFTAALRPSGKDPEGTLKDYRDAGLLLIDDLGAAKSSEWVEEITYRLINGRYEDMRPSIFTTNLPLPQLRDGLGDRIASRLVETCTVVALKGNDRRRAVAA